MSDRAPSNFRLQEAVTILAQARELLMQDEALASDQDLLADYLASDPATCDSMEMLSRLGRAILATEDMAKLSKERAAEIAERSARFKQRAVGMRATLKSVMELLNIRRISEPDLGASLGQGKGRVIADVELLPEQYIKVERTARLAEIGKALDAGIDVPGAVRSNPESQLTIRRG
jgi:hypothetical protein